MPNRLCSECGKSLAGKASQTKTCSPNCRSARSRRHKRQQREAAEAGHLVQDLPAELRAVRDGAEHRAREIGADLLQEELRPVVREVITEDVMRSIRDLVALTPVAVARLQEDLDSDDATIRQRAYTLLIKYTVGHPAMVTKPDDDAGKQLHVTIGLPRPDAPAAQPAIDVESSELRVCDVCREAKPTDEFVGDSERCESCHHERAAAAAARFG